MQKKERMKKRMQKNKEKIQKKERIQKKIHEKMKLKKRYRKVMEIYNKLDPDLQHLVEHHIHNYIQKVNDYKRRILLYRYIKRLEYQIYKWRI